MKLTVIIALYNTEKYIKRCLNSILDTTIPKHDYEIIVINDGSTDGGPRIVEEIVERNNNVILINKENGGQSSARNIGLTLAKGDYIFCLDSDDYVNSDLFPIALEEVINNNLDLYPIQFVKVSEDGQKLASKDSYQIINEVISGDEFLSRFTISGAMARYFYNAEIIRDKNLKLLEGIFHEDEEFVIKFLTHVKRIKYDKLPVYFYLIRSSSTMNKPDITHRKKLINDLISVVDSISNLIFENKENLKIVKGLKRKKQQILLSIFLKLRNNDFDSVFRSMIYSKLKSKNYYPLNFNEISFKQKLVAVYFNLQLF